MNKKWEKEPKKARKSVGARVTDDLYNIVKLVAKQENLTQSKFVLQSIYTNIDLKEHKSTLKKALIESLMNPSLFFEHEKRKKLQDALKFIDR